MSYWDNPSDYASGGPSTNPYGNYTVVDSAAPEILHMVDPHWYQYPPMNPLWYGLLALWMFVMGTLSVCGNSIVIWVFMTTKALRTPANLLVVNLAISDFFMMFCMCPPLLINCYYQTWVWGAFACEVYGCIGSTVGTCSIFCMVFITLDRYNVIVKGVSATPLTTNGAMLRNLFSWVTSIGWCLPPFFGFNAYVPEGNLIACGTDYLKESLPYHLYLYLYSVWCYFLPLVIIVYCYTYIVAAVSAHERQMREQAKKMGVKSLRSEETKKTSNECRLAKVALTTVSLWFIAWTPYLIINWAGMINKPSVSPLLTIWGSVFAKANAVYNPIVYAISHPKYRAALEKKLPCLSCATEGRESQEDTTSTATTNEKSESA
ncbi:rhodopsin-like [Homarus americanus]|uniref:Rhodopsin n=1 Tax=Homarus americanus TaxID=6706 RepID=A0A8J5MN33_HOMAM|nr:rhodopsin-like [Homarus americanus]KAG7157295.1 Rhodopsin-like 5 [Homarus americanus]